jgi:hypothetical protein
MTRVLAGSVVLALALPARAGAHRLDEYLQAVRLSVAQDRVGVEIDLTPGVNVAGEIISLVDRDADRRISGAEAEAYARAVLRDLVLEGDGRPLSAVLMRAEVPVLADMYEGAGMIRIEALAAVPAAAPGRHRLSFRNNHHAERSVYLANALRPDDASGISIVSQSRDAEQREIRIDYDVVSTSLWRAGWFVISGLSAFLLVVCRGRPRPVGGRLQPVPSGVPRVVAGAWQHDATGIGSATAAARARPRSRASRTRSRPVVSRWPSACATPASTVRTTGSAGSASR